MGAGMAGSVAWGISFHHRGAEVNASKSCKSCLKKLSLTTEEKEDTQRAPRKACQIAAGRNVFSAIWQFEAGGCSVVKAQVAVRVAWAGWGWATVWSRVERVLGAVCSRVGPHSRGERTYSIDTYRIQ